MVSRFIGMTAIVLLLAGCSSQSGIGLASLETAQYLRSERSFEMDFVEIQQALFKHQAACDTDIQWAGSSGDAAYVRIVQPFEPGASGWNNTLVLGLTRMANVDTKAQVYSYRTPSSKQITTLYNAILTPEICP